MEIPREKEYSSVLKQGAVFYAIVPDIHPTEPHYLIVLNRAPQDSHFIYLANTTTDIDRICRLRASQPESTVVHAGPNDYQRLKNKSVIDCNDPIAVYKDELPSLDKFKSCEAVSMELLSKLIRGIQDSNMIEPKKKKSICG